MTQIVTAAILIIGDEILSGRTKDQNIGYIAEYLTVMGIDLKEVRVVGDDEAAIVSALNALRARYDYVFTTGGIGPTHDDITVDCVAKAFGVAVLAVALPFIVVAKFEKRFGSELNEARLRMARFPIGAALVSNEKILAPGFMLGNVIVMAGIPRIMHVMLDEVAPRLKTGARILSDTVLANALEGDIGAPLAAIQQAHPATMIGSYPFIDDKGRPNTNLVVRSRDAQELAVAMAKVKAMIAALPPRYPDLQT